LACLSDPSTYGIMESLPAFCPSTADEIPQFLRDRCQNGKPLRIRGGGSKTAFGPPVSPEQICLDLSVLAGITLYEPDELVLTTRAGTRLSEISAAVAERGQCLAFEPPEFTDLLGENDGNSPTLGGVVACGWSGPRRIKAGAVRDHVLGILAIGGDGQPFRSGGRVVKNVTGFDLPKLLTGSHGTLAVMTDITIKVLPAPEATRTLVVLGQDDHAAISLLTTALGGPYEISGAAYLPAAAAARSSVPAIAQSGGAATLIRLEGFGPSVADRFATLEGRFGAAGTYLSLDADECTAVWREVREIAPLVDPQSIIWRLSLRATDAARVAGEILGASGGEALYDWGGGLLWLALPAHGAEGGHAALVRGALSSGHATLMRAPAAIRDTAAIFQPRAPALMALEDRVKAAFDPRGILAPHFMTQGA
jgi:glycolate oxidase FAD binding subunit